MGAVNSSLIVMSALSPSCIGERPTSLGPIAFRIFLLHFTFYILAGELSTIVQWNRILFLVDLNTIVSCAKILFFISVTMFLNPLSFPIANSLSAICRVIIWPWPGERTPRSMHFSCFVAAHHLIYSRRQSILYWQFGPASQCPWIDDNTSTY